MQKRGREGRKSRTPEEAETRWLTSQGARVEHFKRLKDEQPSTDPSQRIGTMLTTRACLKSWKVSYCRQFAIASLWRRVLLDMSKVPHWYFQRIPWRWQGLKDTRTEQATRRGIDNTTNKHISTNPMQSPCRCNHTMLLLGVQWHLKYLTARGSWVGARSLRVPREKNSAGGNDQATTKEAHRNGATRPGPTARQRQPPRPDCPHSHNTAAGSQSARLPPFHCCGKTRFLGRRQCPHITPDTFQCVK